MKTVQSIGYLISLISLGILFVVIVNLNTSYSCFSRIEKKHLESFATSCDQILEMVGHPKGVNTKVFPVECAQFPPEILRFRPLIVRINNDSVWVMFSGRKFIGTRCSVIWRRDMDNEMEWELVLSDGTRSRVLLRRSKNAEGSIFPGPESRVK